MMLRCCFGSGAKGAAAELALKDLNPKTAPLLTVIASLLKADDDDRLLHSLISRLRTLAKKGEVESYLTQLCYILMKMKNKAPLERFMLQKSASSLQFGMQFFMFLFGVWTDATSPTEKQSISRLMRAVHSAMVTRSTEKNVIDEWLFHSTLQKHPNLNFLSFIEKVSETLGRPPPEFAVDVSPSSSETVALFAAIERPRGNSVDLSQQMSHFSSRWEFPKWLSQYARLRYEFIERELHFVDLITQVSENLRKFPNREKRSELLKQQLQSINACVPPTSYMPLVDSSQNYKRVVRIVYSDCKVFSTHTRAPYMILVEVIKSQAKMSRPNFKPRIFHSQGLETAAPADFRERSAQKFAELEERALDAGRKGLHEVQKVGRKIGNAVAAVRRHGDKDSDSGESVDSHSEDSENSDNSEDEEVSSVHGDSDIQIEMGHHHHYGKKAGKKNKERKRAESLTLDANTPPMAAAGGGGGGGNNNNNNNSNSSSNNTNNNNVINAPVAAASTTTTNNNNNGEDGNSSSNNYNNNMNNNDNVTAGTNDDGFELVEGVNVEGDHNKDQHLNNLDHKLSVDSHASDQSSDSEISMLSRRKSEPTRSPDAAKSRSAKSNFLNWLHIENGGQTSSGSSSSTSSTATQSTQKLTRSRSLSLNQEHLEEKHAAVETLPLPMQRTRSYSAAPFIPSISSSSTAAPSSPSSLIESINFSKMKGPQVMKKLERHLSIKDTLELAANGSDGAGGGTHNHHSEGESAVNVSTVEEDDEDDDIKEDELAHALEHQEGVADWYSENHVFGESWHQKKRRIRRESNFGRLRGWDLQCFIVKSFDDLRQEIFAMQLIRQCANIWKDAGLSLYLRVYGICSSSADTGFIEGITDAISLDGLKKTPNFTCLKDYFLKTYGDATSEAYDEAANKFCDSLAGYSIVSYILQIKDRHNGNILLDKDGHLIHIDFGFFLSNSPGGINFENAPFKFTMEMSDVLGSVSPPSMLYNKFVASCIAGFLALREQHEQIVQLVDTMYQAVGEQWPCFRGGKGAVEALRERFVPHMTTKHVVAHVLKLIAKSRDNWRTRQYDLFQKRQNGILP